MTYTCMDTSEAPAQQRCEGRKKTGARGPAGWAAGSPRAGGWAAAGAARAGGLLQRSRSILLLEKQLKIRAPKAAPGRRTAAPQEASRDPCTHWPAAQNQRAPGRAPRTAPRPRSPGSARRRAQVGGSPPAAFPRPACVTESLRPIFPSGVWSRPEWALTSTEPPHNRAHPGGERRPCARAGARRSPAAARGEKRGSGRRTPRADPRRTLRACLSLLPSQGSLLPAPAALLVPEGGTRAQPGGGSSEASRPRRPGLTASAVPPSRAHSHGRAARAAAGTRPPAPRARTELLRGCRR